ncbi:MAG: sensor histidine kinase [Chloroflexi bacterium]|nr:sensor histidine kinase [Chloroflexota bacterium]
MAGQSFDLVLLVVYFAYGLAFFGMGLTLALESERSPVLAEARLLRPLAAFGMLHGVHEWLDSYLLQPVAEGLQLPAWLLWLRLGLLAASFFPLLVYGILTLREHPLKPGASAYVGWGALAVYLLGILASAVFTYRTGTTLLVNLYDVLTRYLLAVPAAFLAALSLRAEALNALTGGRRQVMVFLTWAAIGFGLYGLTQLFVPAIDMFPARDLNSTIFRTFTGFPIQVIRALLAVLIALSLLRATQIVEKERQQQLLVAQQARLEALERIQDELTKREALKRELLRHTVRAQEEERSRIARELHDETSQVLTAFSLDLATLRTVVCDRSEVKNLVDRLQDLSKQMSQGLYRLVHDLRPAQLDDLGLISALEYLKDDSASAGLDVSIDIHGKARRLDSVIETVLFRVAQEALHNVVRHGQVRHALILLVYESQEVTLKIEDSGVGFNPVQSFAPPRGWGLAGMRERVESIGGQLSIQSEPGKGTIVEIAVPVFDILP